MHLFRVRLIVALIASVTLVSLASTYFDVLAHRHSLREDLDRRTQWMGMSIEPDVRNALETGDPSGLPGLTQLLKDGTGALGLAIYDAHGVLLAGSGPPDVMGALGQGVVEKSLQRGVEAGRLRACRAMAMAGAGFSHSQRNPVGRRHGPCGGCKLYPL